MTENSASENRSLNIDMLSRFPPFAVVTAFGNSANMLFKVLDEETIQPIGFPSVVVHIYKHATKKQRKRNGSDTWGTSST